MDVAEYFGMALLRWTLVAVAVLGTAWLIGAPTMTVGHTVDTCQVVQTGMFNPCADLDTSMVVDMR